MTGLRASALRLTVCGYNVIQRPVAPHNFLWSSCELKITKTLTPDTQTSEPCIVPASHCPFHSSFLSHPFLPVGPWFHSPTPTSGMESSWGKPPRGRSAWGLWNYAYDLGRGGFWSSTCLGILSSEAKVTSGLLPCQLTVNEPGRRQPEGRACLCVCGRELDAEHCACFVCYLSIFLSQLPAPREGSQWSLWMGREGGWKLGGGTV